MVIKRSEITAAELPREEVTVDAPGYLVGDVVVQGMDLPQLLQFYGRKRETELREGESTEERDKRVGADGVAHALSMAVLADDGLPVYTEKQWRAFGGAHMAEAVRLFRVAMRLSGQDAAAERKNS